MILYAVSGGIDSMCMAEKARLSGGPFAMAHCNFSLRGADSDADEALVRGWALQYGIRLHVRRFDTAGYAVEKGISIEMAARELRYAWFGDLCRVHGYEAVAVAHNADDNAETMLLNLVRGTGVKGLLGMRPVGVLPDPRYADIPLLRPLLELPRAGIRAFVAEHEVPFREDRTNAENDCKRNKLRNQVFPVLREINPSLLDALGRGREHWAEVEAVADAYYRAHRDAVWDGVSADLAALDALDHPDYVLYRLLEEEGFSASSIGQVKKILHGSETRSGRRVIEGDREVVFTSGRILVRPHTETAEVIENDDFVVVRAPGFYRVGSVRCEVSLHAPSEFASFKTAPGTTLLDAAAVPFPLVLRPMRPGDYLIPLGMKGRKKLSDILSGADIRVKERAVVLLCPGNGAHVSALVGCRIDHSCRITADTETVLRIHLTGNGQ